MDRKQPNYIFFITDQLRYDFLACNGHRVVQTPNLNALAARGVNFDRFYVASPVCMPNRASLMTGRMPSVTGVRQNGSPLSREAVTFVDLLRDAGYATALVGKSHLQCFTGIGPTFERAVPPAGFHVPSPELAEARRPELYGPEYEEELPGFWADDDARMTLPFYGFDHVDLVRGHGDGVGGHYRKWLLARDPDALSLIGKENQLTHDYQCPQAVRTALPAELYHTSYIAEEAVNYLNGRASEPDKPFFLMVSFPDPHHPFNPPGKYWDMYQPDQFDIPEAFGRNDWRPPTHVKCVWEDRDAGRAQLSGTASISVTAREAQEAQALTCGMITMIDDAIGSVMEALSKSGLDGETIVSFTSDHGDHLGDHRLLLKGAEQYKQILQVPFIWSDPAEAHRAGDRSTAIASTIDIAATILERSAIAPFAGLQGNSLVNVINGSQGDGREAAFIQYDHQLEVSGLCGAPRVHTVIDAGWRLSVFHGVEWGELYNLESDPGEFDNLWDAPRAQDQKARLMEVLVRQEIAHIDDTPLPTGRA